MKRLVQYGACAAVVLLGVWIGVAADLNSTLMAVITVGGAIAALIVVESIFGKRQQESQSHIEVDEKQNSVRILQRGQVSRSFLHCSEYMPNGAGAPRTGKYYIYYKNYDRKVVIVNKIFLSTELLAEAQKNATMRKFIVGEHLELRHSGGDTQLTSMEYEVLKRAVMSGDQKLQTHITHRAHMASSLTKGECVEILDWIAGNG